MFKMESEERPLPPFPLTRGPQKTFRDPEKGDSTKKTGKQMSAFCLGFPPPDFFGLSVQAFSVSTSS